MRFTFKHIKIVVGFEPYSKQPWVEWMDLYIARSMTWCMTTTNNGNKKKLSQFEKKYWIFLSLPLQCDDYQWFDCWTRSRM